MEPEKKKSVGAAVKEILEKPKHDYEVQEIIDEYSQKYIQEVQKAVEQNFDRFESPFYIVVIHKKEPWALNVMRNWFITRQTKPTIGHMWREYHNFMHTIYEVDKSSCAVKLLHTLPSPEEAKTIVKNFHLYDQQLVRWCHAALEEVYPTPNKKKE